jgi:hypothetical protein
MPALFASYRSRFADISILAIVIVGTLGFGHLYVMRRTSVLDFPSLSPRFLVWLTPFIIIFTLATFLLLLPIDHARTVGSLGIVVIVTALWALGLSCVFIALPVAYGFPSLALVPWLILLLASFHGDANVFPHPHPSLSRIPEGPGLWTLEERRGDYRFELSEWCKQFTATPGDGRIPVYLVSAEGGGIRAAYWSAAVLAEIDAKSKGEFRKHILAFSGVSGGSLGVATYATAAFRDNTSPEMLVPLMHKYFANDFLSPIVVPLVTTEPLRVLFGDHSHAEPRDRAFEVALAHDWKRASGEDDFARPFLDTFGTNYRDPSSAFMPIIWFNSTIVETGLRGVISNIRFSWMAPTSSDLLRMDVGDRRSLDHITVAEAVHLSARFPYISPPATIMTDVSVDPDPNHHEKRLWGHLVDGGYLDNSAADNFLELVHYVDDQRKYALDCYTSRYSNCSPDPEDQKILNVERRIQIVVIVLRNDPLDRGGRVFEIPSLISVDPDAIATASPCPQCSWNDGFLRTHLPSAVAGEEIVGPPDTLSATREARGAVTRETLRAAMTEGVPNSFGAWCRNRLAKAVPNERGLPLSNLLAVGLTKPLAQQVRTIFDKESNDSERQTVVSWACELQTDFYREYSLAQFLGDPGIGRGQCASGGRGIALGWTLSSGVQERIACIAGTVEPPVIVSKVAVAVPRSSSPN